MPQRIRDESNDRRYFHVMPNLADDELGQADYRLLGHYRRVCGEKGECWESVRTTAEKCRMSKSTVIRTRSRLAAMGWIAVADERSEMGQTIMVTVLDRWADNICAYGAKYPQVYQKRERGCTKSGNATVPNEGNKEEPLKKNPLRRTIERHPKHQPVDNGFLGTLINAFPRLNIRREYEKFCDWKASKGKRFKDDRAAFRNWLRNAEEFSEGRRPREQAKAGPQVIRGDADLDDWERY